MSRGASDRNNKEVTKQKYAENIFQTEKIGVQSRKSMKKLCRLRL